MLKNREEVRKLRSRLENMAKGVLLENILLLNRILRDQQRRYHQLILIQLGIVAKFVVSVRRAER